MSDAKTYIFGENGGTNGMLSALAPLLNKSGLDPNLLLAMNNGGGGFGGNGNWLWIIFLFFIWGWGGNRGWGNGGNGQDGLAALINNDNGRDLLMSAIQGNGTAISQLASTLNCSVNTIQQGINSLMSSVQGVGNQVGMSSMQIINAIQAGNTSIASQIAQCCCENKLLVTQQGYENRIANSEQTAILGGKIDQQTTLLNDKFCQLEMREMQSKIDKMSELAETMLRIGGQLMSCIEELSSDDDYGERRDRERDRRRDWDEDRDDRDLYRSGYNERRGVRGTGRYSRFR